MRHLPFFFASLLLTTGYQGIAYAAGHGGERNGSHRTVTASVRGWLSQDHELAPATLDVDVECTPLWELADRNDESGGCSTASSTGSSGAWIAAAFGVWLLRRRALEGRCRTVHRSIGLRSSARGSRARVGAMYRTPQDPGPILLVVSSASVEALDRRSGQVLWQHRLSSANQSVAPRVVVEGEHVILLSAGDLPGGLFSNAEVPGIVTCLDYRTGRQRWQQGFDVGTIVNQFGSTLLVDAGQVLVALPTYVFAFSLENGALQWRHGILEGAHAGGATALAVPGSAAQADRKH